MVFNDRSTLLFSFLLFTMADIFIFAPPSVLLPARQCSAPQIFLFFPACFSSITSIVSLARSHLIVLSPFLSLSFFLYCRTFPSFRILPIPQRLSFVRKRLSGENLRMCHKCTRTAVELDSLLFKAIKTNFFQQWFYYCHFLYECLSVFFLTLCPQNVLVEDNSGY